MAGHRPSLAELGRLPSTKLWEEPGGWGPVGWAGEFSGDLPLEAEKQ